MQYQVMVVVPNILIVDAASESEAKQKIQDDLIKTGQIKQNSPIIMTIIEDAIISESNNGG